MWEYVGQHFCDSASKFKNQESRKWTFRFLPGFVGFQCV
jgi:hypothetical protein